MKFLWTTLHVSNLQTSLDFYQQQLGLPLVRLMDEHLKIAFLGVGETQLELIEGEAAPSPMISLGFQVDDLSEWLEKLADVQEGDVFAPAPGMRFCFFRDPDGYLVQLVEMGQND